MNYWLFKSEPDAFSIDDLAAMKGKRDHWDGIRNYQARNIMRDQMKKGDLGFFYHSSCKVPGIVGTVEVVKEAYPDHTAFDKSEKYYDAKSDPANPRWFMVDVKLKQKFEAIIPLTDLREITALKEMVLLQKGSRLSVQPVRSKEWKAITKIAGAD
jgi:predicted RNA-binding protein with PUA-like domain